MIAPATSSALDVSRALHSDAHADVSDVTLTDSERVALVEWHLDNGREYGPDADARETFAEALARWTVSENYRRDLLDCLTYPEPMGSARNEAEPLVEDPPLSASSPGLARAGLHRRRDLARRVPRSASSLRVTRLHPSPLKESHP